MTKWRANTCLIIVSFLVACQPNISEDVEQAMTQLPDQIDFNMHVKPILSDRCFACHGPDEKTREGDLRLDLEEHAFAKLPNKHTAFAKKSLRNSSAIQRILSEDQELTMPPPSSNLSLTAEEKAILIKWVQQGAKWKEHWSFIPPEKPEVPAISEQTWTQANPIDNFVQRSLVRKGVSPNLEADKERLLRRVSIDLTGLPPTLEAMDAFLSDTSADAYEKVVDQLIASTSYAERMAMEWLDIARYADSHGLHADGWRYMHPWRDWVIEAFNKNMPYDQFISWQLAGDMIPNATQEQKLATAFHRNHPMTAEGGVIEEEARLEYVFDRTNTTATAILGLTMECARCHDHKFDPISQEEYFQLSAFFNNVKELGMTGDDGNYGPSLLLPSAATEKELAEIEQFIAAKNQEIAELKKSISAKGRASKVNNVVRQLRPDVYLPVESRKPLGQKGNIDILDGNRSSRVAKSLEMLYDEERSGQVLQVDDEFDRFLVQKVGIFNVHESFAAGVWINTNQRDSSKTQVIMGTAGNKNNFWRGWDFYLDEQNRLSARLIHSLPHNYIQLTSTQSLPINKWQHVAFTYDGTGKASGLALYIDGKPIATEIEYDQLYKNILPVHSGNHQLADAPILIGKSGRAFTGESGVFMGKLDELSIFRRIVSPLEIALLAGLEEADATGDAWLAHQVVKDPTFQKIQTERSKAMQRRIAILDTIPEVMVMEEMPNPRTTFVLNRGQYDSPLHAVEAATPASVLEFPEHLPRNRLGLTQWLFSSENPLTARVAVNRYWQLFFGKGLVKTPQDFGNQGALPSHPDLLDWLSVTFRESNWDVKALHKLIVMSNTYRQSSIAEEALRELDPYNDLLARGPSHRWPAEIIRDNALSAAGLLNSKVGGASVKPYQPEGLWIDLGNFSYKLLHYKQDAGDDLYRRSMYTFIRRTSPPPAMTIFDAPSREVCTIQREITNTPLQALVLLNDPTFVEAARVMAERMQKEGGETLSDRIVFAFRLLTGRKPNLEEIQVLSDLFEKEKERFAAAPRQAQEALSIGDYPVDPQLDPIETAAFAMVSSMMINHDEFYTKR